MNESAIRAYTSVPVPLLVNLLEVDTILDDSTTSDEEEHVAEGAPKLVDECPEATQHQEMQAPFVLLALLLPWP